ncbi:MAG: hypothetical protein HYZ54_06075 [Ignavibacteriae bacterium]|nr:hypothetical protein [Ignavibacteriota bacterium]
MKSKSIFWGAFLLSSGIILLLGNYGLVNIYWENVWKLWPIALILIGARAFVKDPTLKGVLSALGGILLGVSLFSGIFTGVHAIKDTCNFNWDNHISGKHTVQQINEPFDSTAKVFNFTLDAGAGNFSIGDTSAQLLDGETESSIGQYSYETEKTDSTRSITVSMQDNGHFHWFGQKNLSNRAAIHLSTIPLWNIDAEFGAAAVQFDLSKYRIGTLSMSVGAAAVKVKLGDKADSTHLDFDGGASSIELDVPTNSGCRITVDESGLNGTDLVGFEKIDDNTYQTSNYTSATKKITMDFDIGVSKLKVNRY